MAHSWVLDCSAESAIPFNHITSSGLLHCVVPHSCYTSPPSPPRPCMCLTLRGIDVHAESYHVSTEIGQDTIVNASGWLRIISAIKHHIAISIPVPEEVLILIPNGHHGSIRVVPQISNGCALAAARISSAASQGAFALSNVLNEDGRVVWIELTAKIDA